MLNKDTIANGGEIAVRIIRARRETTGIVRLTQRAAADSLHTLLADEAICIGPVPSSQSHLEYGAYSLQLLQ